jgi:tetratricopeptide (TPR) repeat protein
MKITSLLFIIALLVASVFNPGYAEDITSQNSVLTSIQESDLELLDKLIGSGKNAQDVVDTINQMPISERNLIPFQIRLARAYVQVGHEQEAEAILLQCFNKDPSNAEVTLLLGKYYTQKQRFDEAENYLSRTLSLDPRNYRALQIFAKVFLVRDENIVQARLCMLQAINIEVRVVRFKRCSGSRVRVKFDIHYIDIVIIIIIIITIIMSIIVSISNSNPTPNSN